MGLLLYFNGVSDKYWLVIITGKSWYLINVHNSAYPYWLYYTYKRKKCIMYTHSEVSWVHRLVGYALVFERPGYCALEIWVSVFSCLLSRRKTKWVSLKHQLKNYISNVFYIVGPLYVRFVARHSNGARFSTVIWSFIGRAPPSSAKSATSMYILSLSLLFSVFESKPSHSLSILSYSIFLS